MPSSGNSSSGPSFETDGLIDRHLCQCIPNNDEWIDVRSAFYIYAISEVLNPSTCITIIEVLFFEVFFGGVRGQKGYK